MAQFGTKCLGILWGLLLILFGTHLLGDFLLLVCAYLFLFPLHVMEKAKLKNMIILIAAMATLAAIRFIFPIVGKDIMLEFLLRLSVLTAAVCFIYGKMCWDALYCAQWPLMIYSCVNMVWEYAAFLMGGVNYGMWYIILFYIVYFIMVYAVLAVTLFRFLPRNGTYQAGPRRTLSAAGVLFLSQYSNYNYYLDYQQLRLTMLIQLYCITFLYLQAELFKKSKINEELTLMERMWYQQKKQYEIAKDQMQVIDRKCHDLKYQVAAMRHIDNPKEREKNLEELEKSIRIYDSIVKTGNDILDTLLSEKSLICEARGIDVHCVIDGEKLSFIDPIDIYALFGNAIDNAIECVEKFQQKEQRFIDICVAEKQHFLYIRISNPIETSPEYEDGLPKTTKKNKQYHGIGLKSIRHIAEKYGGNISVSSEMCCFSLEVLLPIR